MVSEEAGEEPLVYHTHTHTHTHAHTFLSVVCCVLSVV
jgi:hypothetical protein